MITGLVEAIAASSLVVFIGFFALYAIVCYWYTRRPRPTPNVVQGSLPTLTIIVPTYNEAAIIESRFENFRLLNYPRDKLQIVFVDGGSKDGTPDLIEKLKSDLNVILVKQGSRKGFNKALLDGFAQASGELIAFTGAETKFEPDAYLQMVKHFVDANVGAVTGRQRIRNLERASPKIEAGYRSLYHFIRLAETAMDSPFDIKGEICVARRGIVEGLVRRPEVHERGCIDCCLSFQARQMGMKTVYEPDAVYVEDSPYSIRESFAQDIRRGVTLIENMLLFKSMILNRRYGKFGLVIMPCHLIMLMITPFLLIVAALALSLSSILNVYSWTSFVIVAALLAVGFSRGLQGFVKAQLCLAAANVALVLQFDTQRFKKLTSTRILKP